MESLVPYLISPPNFIWLLALKIIFIAFSLSLAGFMIFALWKTTWLKRMYLWDFQEIVTYKPFGVRRIVKQWSQVKARLDTGLEAEYKLAVIEADSILNDILKRMGYGGESLGERLEKLTAASLSNLADVKSAHQDRNNVVHDPNYRLVEDEAKKIIEIFEKVLTDLQAL